jgi:hypothetical protein
MTSTAAFAAVALTLFVAAAPAAAEPARPAPVTAPPIPDGAHDFDFEFGVWTAHVSRRLRPLTGSMEWVEYEGLSTVHPLWGGRANIGELDVSGPSGRILGSSYRLYNPETRQWSLRWANSADGDLGVPAIGGFADGRGVFYDHEIIGGRAVLVRFIFSGMQPDSFQIEQAFSPDGGKTWEANWIATFRRAPGAVSP